MSSNGAVETANKTSLKAHKSEQWEIDAIGRYLLNLHHQKVFTQQNNFIVTKQKIREEFRKFLTLPGNLELRAKFEELNGTADIGTLLFRTNFLLNTKRGSDYYRIKNISFYQYRNEKLVQFDEKRKNGESQIAIHENGIQNIAGGFESEADVDPALLACFEVDKNATSHPLSYQGIVRQTKKNDFQHTSMGCYICQQNFETAEEFEQHVEYHGEESDFEWSKSLTKLDEPALSLSYKLCKNSHYFCFTLETTIHFRNCIIEKIIIIQSHSMYYVHNTRVPYALSPDGKDTFFVDSHLFTINLEQPIVVMLSDKTNKNVRYAEQHHFVRAEEFPAVNFSFNPRRFPKNRVFKTKFALPQYLPPKEIRQALKQQNIEEKLSEMCNEFTSYMAEGKTFTRENLREVLQILLQVEDMDAVLEYYDLIQHNVLLRQYEKEYSLKLKTTKRIFYENVLFPYDEVIILPETFEDIAEEPIMNLLLKNTDDLIDANKKKRKAYFGRVERIVNGRVSFVCDRQIAKDKPYTILFRPMRLNLRYQYRALELLDQMNFSDISRFLFPRHVLPSVLPQTRLKLKNERIYQVPEQLQAVQNIADGPNKNATYIIFGPPGTGKTTTVVEAILQLYERRPDTKILVTAGSNSACDEIALRLCTELASQNEPRAIMRIYSRSSEKRWEHIDELILESSNMYEDQFYPDIDVLHEYRIVICTLSTVGKLSTGKFGNGGIYTHVFVDEVAASTEAETLVGIIGILSPKANLILSGDHKQLGPILQSERAAKLGLEQSLMERLLKRDCYQVDESGYYDQTIQTRLRRNFRSHPAIVDLYNQMYYDSQLIACAHKNITTLCSNWHRAPNSNYPIIFHSVFGTSTRDRSSVSLYNPLELEVVMDYVKDLIFFGVNGHEIGESDIGIISPYKKQYLRIQEELNLRKWFKIETGSVETFQGKEKKIIIVSFVRSFTSTLGFLDCPKRLNVTLSRAKALLILIGNPKTLSMNVDFKRIIDECRRNNSMAGAAIYDDPIHGLSREATVGPLDGLKNSMEKLVITEENHNPNKGATKKNLNKNQENQNSNKGGANKKKRQRKKKWQNTTNNGNNNTNIAISGNDHQQHAAEHLGQSMKKHVKQRVSYEKYKILLTSQKTTMDELFDDLPSVPLSAVGGGHQQMRCPNTANDNVETIEKELHEKMIKLKLKPPTPKTSPLVDPLPTAGQNISAKQQQNNINSLTTNNKSNVTKNLSINLPINSNISRASSNQSQQNNIPQRPKNVSPPTVNSTRQPRNIPPTIPPLNQQNNFTNLGSNTPQRPIIIHTPMSVFEPQRPTINSSYQGIASRNISEHNLRFAAEEARLRGRIEEARLRRIREQNGLAAEKKNKKSTCIIA